MEIKDTILVCIIIIIALAAGLLSAYQYIDGVQKDKNNKNTTIQLIKAQQEINAVNNKISDAQEKALILSEELKNSQNHSLEKSNALIEAQSKISKIQSEIIDQVIGKGYPIFNLMNSKGENFEVFIQGSSDYPLYKVFVKLLDSEKLIKCKAIHKDYKVLVDKSCFDDSLIFEGNRSMDLNGKMMHFIDVNLPKKNYYLITEFSCKNIKTIQYTIVNYDGIKLEYYYRIYDVSGNDYPFQKKLIFDSNTSISEEIYNNHFFLCKTVYHDYGK